MLFGKKTSRQLSDLKLLVFTDTDGDALDDDDDDALELEALVEDSGVRECAINSQRRRNS